MRSKTDYNALKRLWYGRQEQVNEGRGVLVLARFTEDKSEYKRGVRREGDWYM